MCNDKIKESSREGCVTCGGSCERFFCDTYKDRYDSAAPSPTQAEVEELRKVMQQARDALNLINKQIDIWDGTAKVFIPEAIAAIDAAMQPKEKS